MAPADLLNELTISLSSWELAGYISAALVAITVAGEIAHDFNLFKKTIGGTKTAAKHSASRSLLLS
jgi:hypothetical protein